MRLLVIASALATAAALSAGTHNVYPSGADDTARVQAALEACVTDSDCVVQFHAGVYRTRQIFVQEFRGVIRGAGQNATYIEPTARLQVTPAQLEGTRPPSATNLWPILWSFFDSELRLENMGFRVTTEDPAMPYKNISGWPGPDPATHLFALVWVGGTHGNLDVERCSFEGARGSFPASDPDRFNVHWGIFYVGSPAPLLLEGSLRVRSSEFRNLSTAISGQRLRNGSYVIGGSPSHGNLLDTTCYALQLYATDNGNYNISHNFFNGCPGTGPALQITQANRTLRPSTYSITNNQFVMFDGWWAIFIADYIRDGTDNRLADFLISGNHIWSKGKAGGIASWGRSGQPVKEWAGSNMVIANNIVEAEGAADYAIVVNNSLAAAVTGNDVSRFKTSAPASYRLSGSIGCVLAGEGGSASIAGEGANTHTLVGVTRIN